MFTETVKNLSTDQVRQLTAAGIPASRISEWRAEKRLPTRTQTLVFCSVTGIDFATTELELATIEAKMEAKKNSLIEKTLRTPKARAILSSLTSL